MTFLDDVATDLASIVDDTETGFARDVTVTDPDETSAAIAGLVQEIGQEIDADGITVSGQTASVFLRIAALTAAGLGIPVSVPEQSSKPWLVAFANAQGTSHTFKVTGTEQDDTSGAVKCFLEPYETS